MSLNIDFGKKRIPNNRINFKNDFTNSVINFEEIYLFWKQRLIDMAVSSIRWEGLDFVPKNRLEYYLTIQQGTVAYFKDEILGTLVLPCVGLAPLTAYGLPSVYQAWGDNGYRKDGLVDGLNCVVIYNNQIPSNDVHAINLFATRLTNSMLTSEINMQVQKTPFIIETDENDRLTMENVLAKLTSGCQKIFTAKGLLREDNLRVHDLKAPYLVDKITENTQIVWNEWLNYLGVPSQIVQKKERMLQDEVNQTMGGALASRTGRMLSRMDGSEKVKQIFGDEIKPYYAIDKIPIPEYLGKTQQYFNTIRGGIDG